MRPFAVLALCALPLATLPHAAFAKTKPAADAPAAAKQDMDIAAIVGGDAVSSWDVENRIKFIIATAKLSDTPDVIAHIRPQVIRSLIDERLELQEAKKNDIVISDQDIANAIKVIEQQRGMPEGEIDRMMEENHVPKQTYIQQIHAQLAWNKLLIKKIKPQIHVSDEEIQLATQRIMAAPPPPKPTAMPQELQIAVIVLPVDKPARDPEIHRLADKLVREVRGGANFEELSRQFSSNAASAGGKVERFWIRPSQLDPHIVHALGSATPGTVSEPVRSDAGYTIVKIYDVHTKPGEADSDEADAKDMQVTMKEILLKLKPDVDSKEANAMLQIGEEVAKHPGSCEQKGVANIDDLDDFDIKVDFHTANLSELPSALKIIAQSLNVGDISTPFASDEGIRLYMLCDRKDAAAAVPDREQVYSTLMQEKMELQAQKYLRNLRRDAFVEVR